MANGAYATPAAGRNIVAAVVCADRRQRRSELHTQGNRHSVCDSAAGAGGKVAVCARACTDQVLLLQLLLRGDGRTRWIDRFYCCSGLAEIDTL